MEPVTGRASELGSPATPGVPGKLFNALLRVLTLGRDGQSFLDARWIDALLRNAPKKYKRQLALSVLSLSPHYFYRNINPDYRRLSRRDFLESEYERNRSTREKLCTFLLAPRLKPGDVVMDYGCGAGFLANSASGNVERVIGIDLSRGALECARILNSAENVTFSHTTQLATVRDASIDVVYSIAVVQHVTDSIFAHILTVMYAKLKPGGRAIIHVVLDEDEWKTEQDWRRDTSLFGNLKWQYSLHVFNRNEQSVRGLLDAAGFKDIEVKPVRTLCPEIFDDVCTQHLIYAVK